MNGFKLIELRVTGNQPGADIECVATDTRDLDLGELWRCVGSPLRFQDTGGRVVGSVSGVRADRDGIVLKAHVTDATTQAMLADGDLSGGRLENTGTSNLPKSDPKRRTASVIACKVLEIKYAKVAELADAPDLGSGPARGGGSSPPFRTSYQTVQ